jgi:hypothetical protein
MDILQQIVSACPKPLSARRTKQLFPVTPLPRLDSKNNRVFCGGKLWYEIESCSHHSSLSYTTLFLSDLGRNIKGKIEKL